MKCPYFKKPRQWRGRKRYNLASRTLRCILDKWHAGPCALEPESEMTMSNESDDARCENDCPSFVWGNEEPILCGRQKGHTGRCLFVCDYARIEWESDGMALRKDRQIQGK
jgi:hypothetical protein